jgi:DNA repair protein RadA/Sms
LTPFYSLKATEITYRILRSLKNRFGSTAEIGIYEMLGSGLREVSNPSEILISHKDEELSGTAIASTLEGMRPLMIEIQSLVSTAVYGTPQRSTTGYNAKRLNMILAVLEKGPVSGLAQRRFPQHNRRQVLMILLSIWP